MAHSAFAQSVQTSALRAQENIRRRSDAMGSGGVPAARLAPEATIKVQDLRLRTFIGFNPEEKTKQQDVIINIELSYRTSHELFADDVEHALNYKTITKAVIQHVESGRFLLLEKLAGDVLALCSDSPLVTRAKVQVDKPHALRFADSVSVTLEYAGPGPASAEEAQA